MLSSDERMMIGLKVLERLRSRWQDGRAQLQLLLQTNPSGGRAYSDPQLDLSSDERTWPPTLETILEQSGDLSPNSVVVGVCDDGLPFLMDLTNPAPGSLLISSDQAGGKTRLLRALLTSVGYMNSPEQAVYYVIAQQPEEFEMLSTLDHCQGILPIDPIDSPDLILELAEIAETRRRSRPDGPSIILAIDDLATSLDVLDQEHFERLYWLIRHGPRSFVWPIVTLSAEDALEVHPRLLSLFRTRLIGFIHNDEQAAYLSGDQRLDARWIEEGVQFYVPYGDEWLPFWVCDPSSESDFAEGGTTEPETEPLFNNHETEAIKELKAWNERLGHEFVVPDPSIEGSDHDAFPNIKDGSWRQTNPEEYFNEHPDLGLTEPRNSRDPVVRLNGPDPQENKIPSSPSNRDAPVEKRDNRRPPPQRRVHGAVSDAPWPVEHARRNASERRAHLSRLADLDNHFRSSDKRVSGVINDTINDRIRQSRQNNGRIDIDEHRSPSSLDAEFEKTLANTSMPNESVSEMDNQQMDEEFDGELDEEFSEDRGDQSTEYEYINDYGDHSSQADEYNNDSDGNDSADNMSDEY